MATQASVNQVQSMYVAYYGRPGDPAGINWWADQLDNNQGDLSAIIDQFGNSDEYESRYGSLSDSQLINQFYQNTFGRDADEGGLNFYLGKLQEGEFTIASIAKNIWDGVTGDDASITADKLDVANYFTTEAGQDLRNYGSDIIDDVVSMLAGITGSDVSESSARGEADQILGGMGPEIIEQLSNGPSRYEQYMLELINRARLDPAAEASRYGVELGDASSNPVQPLAMNDIVMDAAGSYSSQTTIGFIGPTHPFVLIENDGYSAGNNSITITDKVTISVSGPVPFVSVSQSMVDFIYDSWFDDESLADTWSYLLSTYPDDIGIGASTGLVRNSEALGVMINVFADPTTDGNAVLLGTVFDDNNENNFYTPGEGVNDAIVRVTSDTNSDYFAAYTMEEGGYQIDLQPGTYDIQFTYNGQDHFVNDVVIGSDNVKVDWMM